MIARRDGHFAHEPLKRADSVVCERTARLQERSLVLSPRQKRKKWEKINFYKEQVYPRFRKHKVFNINI